MDRQHVEWWLGVATAAGLFVWAIPVVVLAIVAARKAPTRAHRLMPIWTVVVYFAGAVAYLAVALAAPGWFDHESWPVRFGTTAFAVLAFMITLGCLVAYRQPTVEERQSIYLTFTIIGVLNLCLFAATLAVPRWWSMVFVVPYAAALVPLTILLRRYEDKLRDRSTSPPTTHSN